jgi:protocatechuate 3,4-dioxygenase beta subunit
MAKEATPVEITRRDLLTGITFACAAAPLRAESPTASCVLTPVTGDGPYYFDPKLVRSNIAEQQTGTPLSLDLRVVSAKDCSAIHNARVDVWHSNARGIYSGYEGQRGVGERSDVSAAKQTFLRGTQITNRDGLTQFRTIYPSWYYGRTPHIHFKVFLQPREVAVSQIYFPDDVSDRVYAGSKDYVPRSRSRNTYNNDDMFFRDGRLTGAFCDVIADGSGYRASVVIGIRE